MIFKKPRASCKDLPVRAGSALPVDGRHLRPVHPPAAPGPGTESSIEIEVLENIYCLLHYILGKLFSKITKS